MVNFKHIVRSLRGDRFWSRELVAEALQSLEQHGADLSTQNLKAIDEVLYQRARQFYGNYDTALMECTERGLAHRRNGPHSKEHFYQTMVDFAKTHDDLRVRTVQLQHTRAVNMVLASRIFPDWKTALGYVHQRLVHEGEEDLAAKFEWEKIEARNAEVARERGLQRRKPRSSLEQLVTIEKDKYYAGDKLQAIFSVEGEDSDEQFRLPSRMRGEDLVSLLKMEGWITGSAAAGYLGADPTTISRYARRDFPKFFRLYAHGKRKDYLVHPLLFDHYHKREQSLFERDDFLEQLQQINPRATYHANAIAALTGFSQPFFFEPIRKGEIPSRKKGNAYLVHGQEVIDYFTRVYEEFNRNIPLPRAARRLATDTSRLVRLAEKGRITVVERREEGHLEYVLEREELERVRGLLDQEKELRARMKRVGAVVSLTGLKRDFIVDLAKNGAIKAVRDPFDERWLISPEGVEELKRFRIQIGQYKQRLAQRIDQEWMSHGDIWRAGLPWESIDGAARRGEIRRERKEQWYYSGDDIRKFIQEEYTPYAKYVRPKLFGLPVNHLVSYELGRALSETGSVVRRKMRALRQLAEEPEHTYLFANMRILAHVLRLPILVAADTYDKIDERIVKESFDNADVPRGKRMLKKLSELCDLAHARRLDQQEEFDLMLCYNYVSVAQAVGDISAADARKAREQTEVAITTRYLPVGIKLSQKYLYMADREDRRAEAVFGLLGAARRFGQREYRFLHYAWSSVRGHLLHVSKHYRRQPLDSEGLLYMYQLRDAYKELKEEDRELSLEEVAQKAKVPYFDAISVLRLVPNIFGYQPPQKQVEPARLLSLDAQITDDGASLMYFVTDPKMTSPQDELLKAEIGAKVEEALAYLTPVQREIAVASFIDEDSEMEASIRIAHGLSETQYVREKEKIINTLRGLLGEFEE